MTTRDSGSGGLRFALFAIAALTLLVLLQAAPAKAAAPGIINTGTGCTGQTAWLVSCASQGEQDSGANMFRASVLTSQDADKTINALLGDFDWDGSDFNASTAVNAAAPVFSATKPATPSGYPRSRVNVNYQFPVSNSGITYPTFLGVCTGGTRRIDTKNVRVRTRDSNNVSSSTSNSIMKFTNGRDCFGFEDYAWIYTWGANNFGKEVTPGTSVSFTYVGDDPDSTGSSNFQGINWRWRNLRTGAISNQGTSCPGGGDNSTKTLTANAPNTRGAYVAEGELMDGDGCTDNQNGGYWFPIGTVDVNSASIPDPSIDVPARVNTGQTSINAVVDPPDDPDGGGPQIVQYDLDNNNGNGVSGFEADTIAAEGATITTNQTKTVNVTGLTQGQTYTVRARVIDNGAMDAADSIRRTSGIATDTYKINTVPVIDNQAITAEAGAGKAIDLGATDGDSDTLTYTTTDAPDHGTLTGTGNNRTYTPDADYAGADSFTVSIDDGYNGIDTATVSIQVSPQTQIDVGPSGPFNSQATYFSFSSPTPGATFECSLNGAGFTTCFSPQFYINLPETTHTFEVRAVAAGNTDPTPASRTFTVDVTNPETTIDVDPGAFTNTATPTFEFSADQSGSTFRCRVDSDPFQTCTTPYTTSNLSDGSHTFEVYAIDPAGNEDPTPASHNFTVDTVAPDTTIDSGPSGEINTSAPQYTFSSTDNTATFECKIDSGAWNPCSSPWTTPTLPDGPHTIQIRAVDPAQNPDPTPESRSIVIDTTAPDTTIDTGPGAFTNDDTPELTFSSDDMGAGFQCRVDTGTFQSCTTPFSTDPLADGSHTVQVRAIDTAGNIDPTPASRTFVVDTVEPETTITDGPSGDIPDDTPTFEFTSDEAGSTFECRIDSDPFASCTSAFTAPSLNDGAHTFEVRAIDQANNVDPTPASRSFTVDTDAPGTTIDSGPTGTINANSATFTFSSGDNTATFECKLDSGDYEECTSPQTYNDLGEGSHTFEVRAVDPAGNPDPAPPTATFTVSAEAPETAIDSAPNGTTSATDATIEFSSDDNAATFECRLDGDTFASCTSPVNLTGLDEGPHTFRVRAVDTDSNADPTPAIRSWTVDTTGPTTTIDSGPGGATRNADPSFEFSADEPGSTFECRLDSTDDNDYEPCTSPEALSGLTDDDHTFDVRATDGAGNTGAAASRTFTVDTQDPNTSISSGPSGTTNSTSASFEFLSTESGSSFTCTLDGNPSPCTSPQAYTGLGNGSHTFTVAARDAAGNLDQTPASRTWTVSSTQPQTQITSGPAGSVLARDAAFEFDSTASGATFECALDGGAFEPCTSPKSYSGLGTGDHTFSVRSKDANGVVDPTPATRTFTVADASPPTAKEPPKIQVASGKLKLAKTIQVATITCGTGPCTLSAATAAVKAGKRKVTLTPTAGSLASGASGAVTLSLKGKVYRAIKKKGKGKISVALEATSPVGSAKATTKLKLTAKKKKKG